MHGHRAFAVMTLALAAIALPAGLDVHWIAAASAQAAPPLQFAITVKARQVEPAMRVIRAKQGDSVEIAFTADEAVELHLHGYDISRRVAPGKPADMKFQAKLAGRFPLEAHASPGRDTPEGGAKRRHVTLLYFEVHPK